MMELHPPPPDASAAIAALRRCWSLLLGSFPIVPETKQAVVVRFGKPVRILNRYQPGEPIGGRAPASRWRIPFAENVVWIDKRVLDVDMERQQVLSTDQLRLEVDAFARYRIVDPLRMYIRARTRGAGQRRASADPRLGAAQRARQAAVRRPCSSPERQGVMENVRRGLDRVARQYGAEIIDVRIKRADLPDGTPLESAFERMRTAREQEARSIRAAGRQAGADHPRRSRRRGRARPMPQASARIRDSTTSTARCSPTRRPSSATATTGPRRRPSFCRRRTTI